MSRLLKNLKYKTTIFYCDPNLNWESLDSGRTEIVTQLLQVIVAICITSFCGGKRRGKEKTLSRLSDIFLTTIWITQWNKVNCQSLTFDFKRKSTNASVLVFFKFNKILSHHLSIQLLNIEGRLTKFGSKTLYF